MNGCEWHLVAQPPDMHRTPLVLPNEVQRPAISLDDRLADPERQVDVGRRDVDAIEHPADSYDPALRVALLASCLLILDQSPKLVGMQADETADEAQDACGIVGADAQAGRAPHTLQFLRRRERKPTPPPGG